MARQRIDEKERTTRKITRAMEQLSNFAEFQRTEILAEVHNRLLKDYPKIAFRISTFGPEGD